MGDILKLLSFVVSDIGWSSFYTAPPPGLHLEGIDNLLIIKEI